MNPTASNSTISSKEQPQPKSQPQHLLIPILILVIGLALMVFMIVEESEPGAIPLLLILVGGIWLFIKRYQSRKSAN